MDKEAQLWKNALAAVEGGERCVLLVVVESIGSSPGRAGFKALVTAGGGLFGSIGGGSMEHKLVELARSRLASWSTAQDPPEAWSPFLKRQVHRAEEPADRSGMICSGEQTVAFYPVHQAQQATLQRILECMRTGSDDELRFDQHGFFLEVASRSTVRGYERTSEMAWRYAEPLIARPRIAILGAGHVGLALSRTMDQLGFHVHLRDDRADLNTMTANTWASERSIVDYAHIGTVIPEDPELYVVLVSFGYRTDDLLVRQLVRKRFKYLGMMGSAEKIKKLFADMRKDGFTQEDISRIHAPIGLQINSRTPEEIAVSIAAEIISVKNRA